MSQLKDYIDNALTCEYEQIKVLSDTAINKLTLYKQKASNNQLILIQSNYRNDDVFRKLKSIESNGYLPKIYEVCSEDDYLYVIEEYINGKTLADIIQNKENLSIHELINYLIDLCTALEILHKLNIVHRDIKPENIMISNGKACLIDLSIAKLINNDKNNDTINLGTIGYAAPEQFGFSQSQPTTDIYAFGVLANKLILGVHPTIEIPKGKLGRVIKKCTATQISERYQDATKIKKALKHILKENWF